MPHTILDKSASTTEETYSFTAKIVGRFKRRISLSPENPDTFMDYLEHNDSR